MKTESCEIKVRGMICRSCTDEVSGMLLRTKGVVKATASYRKALAEVSYDPALVTPDELESRIKSLGYDTGERSRAERLLDLGCAALTVLLVWLLLRWGGASPKIGGGSFGALFLVGLLTGLMPCGALYAAWLCAMSSGSAGNGALLMQAFSLGTVPLMLLFASLGALLPRSWTKYLRKLGAVLVTSMGLKMLIGGLLLLRG